MSFDSSNFPYLALIISVPHIMCLSFEFNKYVFNNTDSSFTEQT